MVGVIEFVQSWARCHAQFACDAKRVSSLTFVSGDGQFKFLVGVHGAGILQLINTRRFGFNGRKEHCSFAASFFFNNALLCARDLLGLHHSVDRSCSQTVVLKKAEWRWDSPGLADRCHRKPGKHSAGSCLLREHRTSTPVYCSIRYSATESETKPSKPTLSSHPLVQFSDVLLYVIQEGFFTFSQTIWVVSRLLPMVDVHVKGITVGKDAWGWGRVGRLAMVLVMPFNWK